MVIQIYNPEFRDGIGGAVEYPKTQRCNICSGAPQGMELLCQVLSCSSPVLPFSHSDFNTSSPMII